MSLLQFSIAKAAEDFFQSEALNAASQAQLSRPNLNAFFTACCEDMGMKTIADYEAVGIPQNIYFPILSEILTRLLQIKNIPGFMDFFHKIESNFSFAEISQIFTTQNCDGKIPLLLLALHQKDMFLKLAIEPILAIGDSEKLLELFRIKDGHGDNLARILLKNVNAQGEFCGSENSFLRLYTQKLKPLLKPNHIRSFLLGAKPNDNEIEIGAKPFMLLLARQQGLVADDPQNFTNFFVNEVYSELEKYGAISICSALKYLLASNNCKAILQILVERNPEEFLRFYDALKSLMVRELDDENPSTQRIRIAQDRETLRQFWLSRDLKNKNFAKVLFVNNPERFFEIYRNEIRPVFLENNSLGKIWQLLMLTDKNEISDIADGASIFTLIFQNTPQFFIPFYENEIDASDCPPALKADLLRQFDLINSAIPQTVMSLFHLAAHNPTGFVRFFAKYVRSYLDAQTLESIFTPNLESEFVPLIIAKSNPKDFHEFLKSDIKDIIGDEALKEIYMNSKKLYEGESILLALSHDPLVFQRALEDLTILAQKNIFKYSDILGFNKGDEDCVKRAQLLMTSSLPQAQKLRDEFDRQLQQDQLAADSAIVLNQVQQLQIGDESAAKRP